VCLTTAPVWKCVTLISEPLLCPEDGWAFIWCLGFLFAWAFIIQQHCEATFFALNSRKEVIALFAWYLLMEGKAARYECSTLTVCCLLQSSLCYAWICKACEFCICRASGSTLMAFYGFLFALLALLSVC